MSFGFCCDWCNVSSWWYRPTSEEVFPTMLWAIGHPKRIPISPKREIILSQGIASFLLCTRLIKTNSKAKSRISCNIGTSILRLLNDMIKGATSVMNKVTKSSNWALWWTLCLQCPIINSRPFLPPPWTGIKSGNCLKKNLYRLKCYFKKNHQKRWERNGDL